MKKIVLLFLFLFSEEIYFAQQNYAEFIDPFIGTGGHGHTFPGATVPFGMVQLSPDTRIDGSWDGCSGYHQSDSTIYGFSHTHLSGTGCSDYGDIMIMPMMGNFSYDPKVYSSTFSHKSEKANAGFYSVKLDDDNIDVELTTTTRVGMHKYTFNKDGDASVLLDLQHRDKLLEGSIKIIDSTTIEGIRRSEAWARDQVVYYRIVFSKPFISKQVLSGDNYDLKASFNFKVKKGERIFVKVALSPVSTEGAKKNMIAELPHWDFEKVRSNAKALWNAELSKIEIKDNDKNKLKTFYTALYHTMIQPNIAMDIDSMYRGRDNKIHKANFTYYSVFSLWDTFRGAHPLYTIIEQKRTEDFIKTFLAQYKDGGRLPVWELASNETDCMIGYHSVSVIADAAVKGLNNFDTKLALEAMKKSATWDHLGLPAYMDHGFLAMDDEHESVSKTLEYAYDDYCIAQLAQLTGYTNDHDIYIKRSQNWKNIFDTETGFMRPKKNGGWLTPFDPREVNNNFTEGNAWQYTFFVPQDIDGLVNAMGGADKFEKKLDELFSASSKTTGREQADITGLIGQYAQGNEPSHHMAYLYNYIGKPWETQQRTNQLLTDFYKPAPDGLIGNEDCGQMSAWYVLSSMGLYQVCPGNPQYCITSPLFSEIKINLENKKTYTIKTIKKMDKDIYINSSGIKNFKYYVNYSDINKGSETTYTLTSDPSKTSATAEFPKSVLKEKSIVPVPVIITASKTFHDSLLITIKNPVNNSGIYFLVSFEDSLRKNRDAYKKYDKSFYITKSCKIYAYALSDKNEKSYLTSAELFKIPNNWKIKTLSIYNPKYTAGGTEGLIDGIYGTENWRKGEWQGYQSQNFEAIIDLNEEKIINNFSSTYLQDTRSWILMPINVEYYWSSDGKIFHGPIEVSNTIDPKNYDVTIKDFPAEALPNTKARYIKVKAYNFGKLPQWHQGFGDDAFIFIDEINVR